MDISHTKAVGPGSRHHDGLKRKGAARVLLNPLAEIEIRMLVSIVVDSGQLMVNTKGSSKRCHCQDNQCYGKGKTDFGDVECAQASARFEHR